MVILGKRVNLLSSDLILISFTNNSILVHTKIRLCTSNPQQNPTISPRMVVRLQTKTILYQNLWNFAILSAILLWVSIRLKKLTQVPLYVVCTQVRRHVHKKNHKKKIRGRKTGTFCFWKTSFVHSRSGTCYALLLRYFDLKFVPNIRHCAYWVLTEIWAPNSSHKIWNNFFINHCQGWKEGSFVCETVWFLS